MWPNDAPPYRPIHRTPRLSVKGLEDAEVNKGSVYQGINPQESGELGIQAGTWMEPLRRPSWFGWLAVAVIAFVSGFLGLMTFRILDIAISTAWTWLR